MFTYLIGSPGLTRQLNELSGAHINFQSVFDAFKLFEIFQFINVLIKQFIQGGPICQILMQNL